MTDWVRRGKRDEIRGPFLESPGNFSNPESCFMFPVVAFKIKFFKKQKFWKWKVELSVNETKLTGLELGTGYYSKGFDF